MVKYLSFLCRIRKDMNRIILPEERAVRLLKILIRIPRFIMIIPVRFILSRAAAFNAQLIAGHLQPESAAFSFIPGHLIDFIRIIFPFAVFKYGHFSVRSDIYRLNAPDRIPGKKIISGYCFDLSVICVCRLDITCRNCGEQSRCRKSCY